MMKNRLLKIKDSGTELYCIVNQFEEIDKEKCNKIGIPTNYRIINVFNGTRVCTFAGYNFNPEYFENRVFEESYEGTFKAIGNVLNSSKDLKYLPDEINVEQIRKYYNSIKCNTINIEQILEDVSVYDSDKLCKMLYIQNDCIKISIFDTETKDCIFEEATSSKWLNNYIASYLWIPVKEISVAELSSYKFTSFNYTRILPK